MGMSANQAMQVQLLKEISTRIEGRPIVEVHQKTSPLRPKRPLMVDESVEAIPVEVKGRTSQNSASGPAKKQRSDLTVPNGVLAPTELNVVKKHKVSSPIQCLYALHGLNCLGGSPREATTGFVCCFRSGWGSNSRASGLSS